MWLAVRAPVGPALGLQPLFSPATFFRPLLGPLSGSAGVLALAGILLTIGGVWLWRPAASTPMVRRGARERAPAGVALPHQQPRPRHHAAGGGVPIGLWLSWQLALLVSAAALIVPTAALFRGSSAGAPGLAAHRRWA